jgi:uncharacterized membrane protein YadS
MHDEELWKGRFQQVMLARLASVAILLLGLAVTFGDLVEEGGSPQLGALLVIIGALASLFAPKLLKKRWKQP